MHAADLVGAVEVGERARHPQHPVVAARRQPHGVGGVAQEREAGTVRPRQLFQHRPVLEDYSAGFLDKAIVLCAAGMVVAYAWYTLAAETALIHGTGSLILTLPWVLLGTLRYLYRLHFRGGGGDPAVELLRDPLLAVAVAGWIATVLWLIG